MADSSAARLTDGQRFAQILGILNKHRFSRDMTPEKLLEILEDLGPTFVKLGQILSMRSDFLPPEYCRALEGLRTDVTPMSFETVLEAISDSCGGPWEEVFSRISPEPLGSASIAQAHGAALLDGTPVVVKVQRPNIKAVMERDIRLMKKAAGLLKLTSLGGAVDIGMVLDEMWKSLQEELDFNIEAAHLEEFRANQRDVNYVDCPQVYKALTNEHILVMEDIEGYEVDDARGLIDAGYDLDEIATKLVNNYIKQITVDRFFHADPHPGNIRVQDGKIIWLDLGMMGRLTKREADLYMGIIKAIYADDALNLTDVVLALGKYDRAPDRLEVSTAVDALLARYKAMSMADMNLGSIVGEFVEALNKFGVSLPASLTMLGRSLLVIQGMLSGVSPDLNVMEIVADYIAATITEKDFMTQKAREVAKQLLISGDKLTVLPEQASDLMRKTIGGQLVINLKHSSAESEAEEKRALVTSLCLCLLVCALVLAAALICLSPLPPAWPGLPWPASVLFGCAVVLGAALLFRGRKKK